MNCSQAKQLLHAYVDDELDIATAGQLNAHLVDCAGCRRSVDAARGVKIAVGNPALYQKSSAQLRDRLTAMIPAEAAKSAVSVAPWPTPQRPSERAEGRSLRKVLALAASFIITAGVALAVLNHESPVPSDEQTMLDLHLRSMQLPDHLMDVVSTDQHTVKPWFDGKLDFAPPVWQLADKGFPLAGGRLESIHNRPAAALVYRHGLHVINLFIWQGAGAASGGASQGFNFNQWTAGGLTFWAVSDMTAADMEKFAELYRSQS